MSELEHWARAAFNLDDHVVVMFREDRDKTDPPGTTTRVDFVGPNGPQSHHLHLARTDITPAHLWQLAAGDDHCCR